MVAQSFGKEGAQEYIIQMTAIPLHCHLDQMFFSIGIGKCEARRLPPVEEKVEPQPEEASPSDPVSIIERVP